MVRERPPALYPPLSIRKRFVIFSAAWLVLCTILLTAYLVSQARHALIEIAVQRSQSIATSVAQEATLYLHAGDDRALVSFLNEVQKQPDVIAAMVEQDRHVWGRGVTRLEVLEDVAREDSTGPSIAARLVRADGRLAIESREPIVMPKPSDVLSDQPLSIEAGALSTPSGYAVVIVSVERIFKEMDALVGQSMLFWVLVLGIGLLVGWFVSGVMVSPLRQLADSAHQWTIGSEEATRPSSALAGDDEIRSLWASLTAMKHALDQKTTEIARLQGNVEDTVRKQMADLQGMNCRLSEILALKNDLLLQVSHEVKTPLTALSGLVSNLRDGVVGDLTGRQQEYLAKITATMNQIKRLLTTLLEFAMAETGKVQLVLRPIELTGLAHEVLDALQPLQDEKGVACVIANSMQGQWAVGDHDRVRQILLNLVHNAVKASRPRSTVSLDAHTAGSEVTVSVRDSGLGISPADRATLFRQPVPSGSDPPGSGVGLYICRYLVELHGGRIWFESDEGKGTAFFFTLTASPGPNVSQS